MAKWSLLQRYTLTNTGVFRLGEEFGELQEVGGDEEDRNGNEIGPDLDGDLDGDIEGEDGDEVLPVCRTKYNLPECTSCFSSEPADDE